MLFRSQDSLTLAIFLWIQKEEGNRFKGNTLELRKKLLATAKSEELDSSWWPERLNWFSKRVMDRARRLKKLGIIARRLTDEHRSWEIAVEGGERRQ